jgi:uncharacterized repeat protein (TIGR01451 family)
VVLRRCYRSPAVAAYGTFGHRLVDEFLRFAGGRARSNTVRAYAHDLKTFFSVVAKDPVDVRAKDVLAFVTAQQQPRVGAENVTRISDGGSGLSSATVRRRLAAVSAFYGYLVARGDTGVDANPVPRGLPTRRRRRDGRGQPLVRAVRRLPRILEPEEVAALLGALRTQRDRAMVQASAKGSVRRPRRLPRRRRRPSGRARTRPRARARPRADEHPRPRRRSARRRRSERRRVQRGCGRRPLALACLHRGLGARTMGPRRTGCYVPPAIERLRAESCDQEGWNRMGEITWNGTRAVRALVGVLALLVALFPLTVDPAAAADPVAPTYRLRHVQSAQFLASDGWGPSVLVSSFDGRMAEWERIANPDGTFTFQNAVTGWLLDHAGGTNRHDVGVAPQPSGTTSWDEVAADGGLNFVHAGVFLVADGFAVRTSTSAGPQALWELVPVDPSPARFVTLTNEQSGQQLAVSGATDGTVITTEIDGTAPATARWELIEQVTTSHKCERHPAWNIPNDSNPAYSDSSRVTTCHVLRNRANDRALDGNSAETAYAVTTTSQVDHDAYWILSDIAPAIPITLQNAAFSRYLADADGLAVTAKDVTSTARWILTDVDGGCAPLTDVQIDSHQQGEIVDTTEAGNATGSFVLFGAAPPGTTSIVVETDAETGHPAVEQSECALGWSIEVAAIQSQRKSFTAVATGPFGERRATIDLDVIAPSEADVLVQPTFATTPQFHGLLVSYDEATGTLVFAGDVSNELDPGDGLGGGVSAIAPNGYLRIVMTAEFDGTNTVVTTRQAGITELVRQIDIHYESDTEPVNVTSSEPSSEVTSEPTDLSFSETAPPGVEVGAAGGPEAEDGGGMRPAEGEPAMASSNALAQLVPIGDDAELDLELIVDPGADFDLDIGWERSCWYCIPVPTVETFAFEVSLDLSAEVEFVYRGATLFQKSDNFGPRFDDFRFATISVPTPIGVPIVITFEAESQPFYEISVDAVARIQYALTFRITAGFEHKDDGTGRGAYRDASFAGDSPSLDFDLGILATVAAGLEVDVEGLLYGQAGIELEARPQIELEAIGDLIDREVAWEVKLVVPFEAGIEIEIKLGPLGWEAEIGDLEFLELSFILFSGTFRGDTGTTLAISQTAPPGVFPGQQFEYTVSVENTGEATATDVSLDMVLPGAGSFVSSEPPGFPAAPAPSANFSIPLPDIAPGATRSATIRWKAPQEEGAELTNTVTATSENSTDAGPVTATVIVGLEGRCNPCGAASGGAGLRNRSQGTIEIAGLPPGATVTRAVLIWGILYSGAVPRDTITLAGTEVTADVAATVSGDLCWGDTNTIGYAADVTELVTGNGSYIVSDPPRGITRVDSEPRGVLPYTDGASLVVFYVGGGANNQVISDFTYNTNTDASGAIFRSFNGVNSLGLGARLTLAGPDGQSNAGESFTISGAGTPVVLTNTFDGSDPQEGPSFAIGSLWDTDVEDVTAVLPSGQTTLTLSHAITSDCIGIGAAVLEVDQG